MHQTFDTRERGHAADRLWASEGCIAVSLLDRHRTLCGIRSVVSTAFKILTFGGKQLASYTGYIPIAFRCRSRQIDEEVHVDHVASQPCPPPMRQSWRLRVGPVKMQSVKMNAEGKGVGVQVVEVGRQAKTGECLPCLARSNMHTRVPSHARSPLPTPVVALLLPLLPRRGRCRFWRWSAKGRFG